MPLGAHRSSGSARSTPQLATKMATGTSIKLWEMDNRVRVLEAWEWKKEMNFRVMLGAAFILSAGVSEAPAYQTGVVISACEEVPHGVFAADLKKGDDPTPDLNQEAMSLCPLGYDRPDTQLLDGGKKLIWRIECHRKEIVASKAAKSCTHGG